MKLLCSIWSFVHLNSTLITRISGNSWNTGLAVIASKYQHGNSQLKHLLFQYGNCNTQLTFSVIFISERSTNNVEGTQKGMTWRMCKRKSKQLVHSWSTQSLLIYTLFLPPRGLKTFSYRYLQFLEMPELECTQYVLCAKLKMALATNWRK